jgi:hypothetical protein
MARTDSLSVAELEQLLRDRLIEQRDRLAAELAETERRLGELGGGAGGEVRRRVVRKQRPGGGRRNRNQPALPQVIQEVLQKTKKPLSTEEVMERVLATGYKTTSANFKNVVYLNLFKMRNNSEIEFDAANKTYSAKSA